MTLKLRAVTGRSVHTIDKKLIPSQRVLSAMTPTRTATGAVLTPMQRSEAVAAQRARTEAIATPGKEMPPTVIVAADKAKYTRSTTAR